MLVLYTKNTTSFSNLGLGILRDFNTNPLITEVLNGEYNLEFEYINGGWLSEELIVGNIIKANDQLFRIWDIQPDLTKFKVLAKHIFFDLSKNFVEDVSPTNLTANNALNWILSRTSTPTNFVVNGNCTSTASARYVRKNVIDAIYSADNALLKKFGGELEFDNYNVYVHQKRGNNTGFTVLYGKNLSGVQMDIDLSTVVTKIMPQGKDELLLDELYVESPLINNYFSPFYQKIDFNDIGINEEEGIDESTAKNQLRLAAQQLFNSGIDKPTMSIKIDFVELSKTTEYKQYQNLETVSLGDTIKAIIPKLNLNLETRVVKTVYDCILERITKIECGTVTPNIVTSQSNSTREIANKLQEINVDSILSEAQQNATDLINHPFGGHIFISESTGELFIMNTSDPITATQVWKWGLGGLGFSSHGINGPYGIAMTQDGKINADYITTGTLSANIIEGYENLLLQVNKLVNLVSSIENENYIHIENAMEGQLQELTIQGNINLIYPANDLYPSNTLYPIDTYLIVDTSRTLTQNAKKYHLPFYNLNSNEKFRYSKGKCYIIHSDESIEELSDIDIQLFEGDNYLYLESFQNNINLTAKYVIKSEYTDVFSTKAEMNSAINQASQTIDLKLEKKTDKENIIAQINMSTEKDKDGSYIGIEADKLSFKGKIINMTGDNIKIKGKNLDINSDGIIKLKDDTADNSISRKIASYIIESSYDSEYEGQSAHVGYTHEIYANGRKNEYENDNQIQISTGYGHYFGGIDESLYRYPITNWYMKSDDYNPYYNTGTYNGISVGVNQIMSTILQNKNYSNPLILTAAGQITCVSLTQTSLKRHKKNFEKLNNAKDILNQVDIYKYNFKNEDDNTKKSIGFVIGDNFNYSQEITSENNDGVNVYSMVSVLWQVVKEQQEEIKELREMIKHGI